VDGNSAVKNRGMRLLSRREFNERCVALGSFALALEAASAVASTGTARTVATVPLSRRSVRAPGILGREDIRQLKKKKHYARAFLLG
jgi:hypothetical protein